MAPNSDNSSTLRRTLCFYSDPPDGQPPSYIAETSDTPGSRNYEHQQVQVDIHDIRGRETDFSLDTHSFAALSMRHSPLDIDFGNPTEVSERYFYYVEFLLCANLPGATDIVAFDHTIRTASSTKIPAWHVKKIHIDQSPRGALGRAKRHLSKEVFDSIKKGEKRFAIINVWKPIRGPVTDHPLTFADCRSIRQSDLVAVKQIYPEFVGETYALKSGSHQKFWYWSEMDEKDVLLLQCFDSAERVREDDLSQQYAQCAHGSFELNEGGDEKYERQSIEVRCLVVY